MFRYLTAIGAASALLVGASVLAPAGPAMADTPAPYSAQAVPGAPQVRSGDYRLDKSHAKIHWSVWHFGFSEYTGEFTDFDASLSLDGANPERSRLAVTVATPSIATNDGALDTHLKSDDFFDVAAHPRATFNSTAITRTGATTALVTGDFTLRGQTHPLTLNVTFNKADDNMAGVYTAGFSATGVVRRSLYGMTYGLPAVGDEIALRISGEFNLAN